jgi:hypothetical protein
MFGCTEQVARSVAEGLRTEGVAVTLTDVRDAAPADESEFDLLVVDAPTHAFSLSRPSTRADAVRQGAQPGAATTGLREWLDATGVAFDAPDRLAAVFDTPVTKVRRLPKAAATRAAHVLTRHGYDLVSRPTPFLVEDLKGPLLNGELHHAVTWGRVVAPRGSASTPLLLRSAEECVMHELLVLGGGTGDTMVVNNFLEQIIASGGHLWACRMSSALHLTVSAPVPTSAPSCRSRASRTPRTPRPVARPARACSRARSPRPGRAGRGRCHPR